MANDGMSEGEYQEGTADPPPPEGETVGDLAAMIGRFSIVAIKSAFMVAELDETDFGRAAAFKAAWMALGPHAEAEVKIAEKILARVEKKA